jgi:oxygen-independent coproporphyrinogen III oxidase
MDPGFLKRYDIRAPRYTSYPTAPNFHVGIDSGIYRTWLSRINEKNEISIYVHVPFCASMCWYCGCHTRVVQRYGPIADYVKLLAREIELVSNAMSGRPRVSQIHWGGGTPNMLSPQDFSMLMGKINFHFTVSSTANIDVEIDPRALKPEMVQAFADAGVNRASLGVQDFSPDVQKAINREQPYEATAESVALLRTAGIEGVNFDLMYGLPHQTVEKVIRSVDLANQLAPDRLAIFGYAHVPWMKTHQKLIDETALPDAAARFHQSKAAADRLMEHGYRRIGMDHFVRPDEAMSDALDNGTLTRNFQGYTTDHADALVGFGASAIGNFHEGYVQNAVPFGQYAADIQAGELAVRRGIEINDDDRLRRTVIERLMCDLTVALDEICDAFDVGYDYFDQDLAGLSTMRDDGIVDLKGHRISITERGRPLMRNVCAAFDRHLGAGKGRHSRAI